MVAATNAAAVQDPAAAGASSSALGRARLAENFDTFLSLLTTQLKNQDPLSPLDSNAFTQQIVQMTGVEQQLATNDLLQKLVSNTSGGLDTAVSLIGKQVRAQTADSAISNGQASWVYKLDSAAADVKLEVLDSTGRVVATQSGAAGGAGEHAFNWNGKDLTGSQLPDGGTYTLQVTASDASGQPLTATTYVEGVVSGVEQVDGKAMLTINKTKIGWDAVTSVTDIPKTPTPGSTADTAAGTGA
jgi:flagellar basal-body rod modification protein FlgD